MRKLEGHISATAKPGRNAQALVFTPAKRAPEELITGNNREDLDPEENRVRNCVGCGFIYTQHRYAEMDSCQFCRRPMTSHNKKENRRRKEEGEDHESLIKAELLRDRLVLADMQARGVHPRHAKVTDDDVIN